MPRFFISKSMARATMSRGASSARSSCAGMKRVPAAGQLRRQQQPPSPRTASDDQEGLGVRVVQAGRVELDELHVRHAAAGAPCHRDAVAGRGVGIGRVQVDLAGAAGGQHRVSRLDRHRRRPLCDVERVQADDSGAAGRPQACRT